MKIGVDLRPLQNNNRFRGIGKLTEYLLVAIAKIPNNHQFFFYVDPSLPRPDATINLFPGCKIKYVRPHFISKIKYVRAFAKPYSTIKTSSGDIDVLLQTDPWNGIPKNVPTVAYFHDIIPMLFKLEDRVQLTGLARLKHNLSKKVADRNYSRMLASYKNAAHIVSISESSKNDFLKYVDGGADKRISTIPPGLIGGSNLGSSDSEITKRLGLQNTSYILYVGGIDVRKNIIQLLVDLKTLHENHPKLKLVLVGKEFTLQADLAKLGWIDFLNANPYLKDSVIYAGFVDQKDMSTLYGKAAAFVFPSRYEGFGLPILEAMDAGCPVVCYDNSSIPEVAGSAAVMVKDGLPMATSIDKLLRNSKLRSQLITKGKFQLKKFNWDNSAKEVLRILKDVSR